MTLLAGFVRKSRVVLSGMLAGCFWVGWERVRGVFPRMGRQMRKGVRCAQHLSEPRRQPWGQRSPEVEFPPWAGHSVYAAV